MYWLREMKQLKSIKHTKILFLLLVVFLIATMTEGPCDFSYDLHKVTEIGYFTYATNSYSENGPQIKYNFLGIVFKYQRFCINPLLSNYSYICMESWSPRDIHFPIKSDRAPPEKNFS